MADDFIFHNQDGSIDTGKVSKLDKIEAWAMGGVRLTFILSSRVGKKTKSTFVVVIGNHDESEPPGLITP